MCALQKRRRWFLQMAILLCSYSSFGQLTDFFRIRFLNSANYADEAIVRFKADATREFDPQYDAFKLNGSVINISTLPDSLLNLFINAMPLEFSIDSVFLKASGPPGNYRLVFSQLNSFTSTIMIFLIDRMEQNQRIIQNGDTISFSITSDPLSNSWKRFVLRFLKPTSLQVDLRSSSIKSPAIVFFRKGQPLSKEFQERYTHVIDFRGRRFTLQSPTIQTLLPGTYWLCNELDCNAISRLILLD